jgi:hypothetical protein
MQFHQLAVRAEALRQSLRPHADTGKSGPAELVLSIRQQCPLQTMTRVKRSGRAVPQISSGMQMVRYFANHLTMQIDTSMLRTAVGK